MGKRIRLKRGDIFRFDLDEARYGVGQIIEPGVLFYMTVLRTPLTHDSALAEIDTSDILLCGRTTDALFFHGRWHIVGNLPVPEGQVPKPNSKVRIDGEKWVADFHGQPLRRATDFEWEQLDYQGSHSPITYEDAFKAYHGLAPAKSHHERLGIDYGRMQAAIPRVPTWRRLLFSLGRRRTHRPPHGQQT